jgi:hypothetical protein
MVQYDFTPEQTCKAETFNDKKQAFDFAIDNKGVLYSQTIGQFEPIKIIAIANFR